LLPDAATTCPESLALVAAEAEKSSEALTLEPKLVTKNAVTSKETRKIDRNLMALFWMRFI
jgi:hypothetical protein